MPSIASITPSTFDSGRSVTLTGSGFGASQGQVLIGGVAQNVNTWSDTSITFTTVRGSQSLGACRVDVVGGGGLDNLLYYEDFSGLSNGANFYSSTRFDVQSSPGVIDDDPKGTYGKVVKDIMTTGQEDKCWGGVYDFRAQEGYYLASGDEIWIAFRLLLPTGSSTVASPRLKFLRLNVYNAALATVGYIDTLLPVLASSDAWVYSNEVLPGAPITQLSSDDTTRPDLDQWQTWQFHIVLDDTAAGSGGTGKAEFWKNGTLVGALNAATLAADTQLGRRVLLHDYWNGGAPQNQTFYWTDFACAVKAAGWRDDTPYLITDSGGRLMIGL